MSAPIYDALFGTGAGARYARIDPADTAAQPRIWFDALEPNDDTALTVTQPDDRYAIVFTKAQKLICFLGAPDAPIDGYVRCFETRPIDARGPSESPMVGTWQNGQVSAQVEYVTEGFRWFSAALCLVQRP